MRLTLALEDGDGIAVSLLLVLLQGVRDHPQGPDAITVARLHRGPGVRLDLHEYGFAHPTEE